LVVTLSRSRSLRALFRRWNAAAFAIAVLAGDRVGEAEPLPGVSVRWVAPATCPSADALQARVRRLLPVDAAAAPAADRLIAEGTVEVVNGHYRLKLSVRRNGEPAGVTRVFESDTCESLAGAAAVTLALLAGGAGGTGGNAGAVGSASAGTTARSETAAPPASAPPPAPSPPAPDATAPVKNAPPAPPRAEPLASIPPAASVAAAESSTTPPARKRLTAYLEAPLLAIDQGMLPSLGSGIGVGAGIRDRGIRVFLAGRLWLPQDAVARTVYAATYERRSGTLSGCYGWAFGAIDLGPCATLAVEDVSARGAGPDVVGDSGHATWLTAGFGGRAGWSLTSWAVLFLRPSLTFNTSRPTFAISGIGPLYQVPLASVAVDLGCEWIL
jgi:hypothetical protein